MYAFLFLVLNLCCLLMQFQSLEALEYFHDFGPINHEMTYFLLSHSTMNHK